MRLRVADTRRTREWLETVVGVRGAGDEAGRIRFGAGTESPLIELRERAGARRVPHGGRPGIYHYALLLPGREDLGRFLLHLEDRGVAHADADHLVSEAIYLVDPDGITVEVYADRPREAWRHRGGEIEMATLALDHASLARAAGEGRWAGLPAATRLGHVHFHVGDLAEAERFYVAGLGFAVTSRSYPGALFTAAGGYHHHVALNTWAAGRAPAGPDDAGLDEWTLGVSGPVEREAIARRLEAEGWPVAREGDSLTAADPWGIRVRVASSSG